MKKGAGRRFGTKPRTGIVLYLVFSFLFDRESLVRFDSVVFFFSNYADFWGIVMIKNVNADALPLFLFFCTIRRLFAILAV
jgi:hypothetical protein